MSTPTETVMITAPADPVLTRPTRVRDLGRGPIALALAVLVVGLVVRSLFLDVVTGDYRTFLSPWVTHLAEAGGLAGLADVSSNYNSPYLVLLALTTYLPVDPLLEIKIISCAFDVLLAVMAYRLVAVALPGTRWRPVITAAVVFVLPTVIMNGAVWGQCDSIYASLGLAALYLLITRRAVAAWTLFGLSLAFKLQAIFLLPVLLGVMVTNRLRWRALLAVPVTYAIALLPAWFAGRSWLTQLLVYPEQMGLTGGGAGAARGRGAGQDGGRGGFPGGAQRGGAPDTTGGGPTGAPTGGGVDVGSGHAFTANAPTWYAWLPSDAGAGWKYAGLVLVALVTGACAAFLLRLRRPLTAAEILLVAATSTLIIPILLPEMHERYFFLAEVLTVLAIVVNRGFSVVAVCIQAATITTYLGYLLSTEVLSLPWAAVIAGVGGVTAVVLMVVQLRRAGRVAVS